jgi:hypothetical protein
MTVATRILLAALGVAGAFPLIAAAPQEYASTIEKWRQGREERLKSDEGWLTVAGLYWLREGENRFGTDAGADIVLPAGTAPGLVGSFLLKDGKISVRVEHGASVTSSGRQITTMDLKPDSGGKPDVLALGDLSMFVIERGGRFAIRLRDKNSPMRRDFTGLRWYPVQERYRVTAQFTEYDPPKPIAIPNILGMVEKMPSPGYATFTLNGKRLRLEPVIEDPGAKELFFIFKDATSGKTTYPAGRFLYADPPKGGKIHLDFNKAYNPPCAFTPYATCPLPPRQNVLAAAIEAGELDYGHHEPAPANSPARAPQR